MLFRRFENRPVNIRRHENLAARTLFERGNQSRRRFEVPSESDGLFSFIS